MIVTTGKRNRRPLGGQLHRRRAGIVVRSPEHHAGVSRQPQTNCRRQHIESYAVVCESAREDAFERMVQHAEEKVRTRSSP